MKNQITKEYLKQIPDIKTGDTIKVHQKIKEREKQRIQVFEGLVLAKKHGKGITGTITVRKIIAGIGTEKIFPIHSPNIEKIEIISRGKVRRSKLYFLRDRVGKKAKIKRKDYTPETETLNQKKTPESKPVSTEKTEK